MRGKTEEAREKFGKKCGEMQKRRVKGARLCIGLEFVLKLVLKGWTDVSGCGLVCPLGWRAALAFCSFFGSEFGPLKTALSHGFIGLGASKTGAEKRACGPGCGRRKGAGKRGKGAGETRKRCGKGAERIRKWREKSRKSAGKKNKKWRGESAEKEREKCEEKMWERAEGARKKFGKC